MSESDGPYNTKLQLTLNIDSGICWTPELVQELLTRISLPLYCRLEYLEIEPTSELNTAAELIEFELENGGDFKQSENALRAIEAVWGHTPEIVRLSTRISRMRILGK